MTIRPATTDQQPAVYGATQPARLVITETVAASRTQGDGPWTTAEAILAALDREGYRIFRPVDESLDVWGDERPPLDREGYTVAPRASEAVMGDGSPTPDVGAVRGREGGSAAESEPRCESTHPDRDRVRCTLPAGHDTHRRKGEAWTTLDRLDDHALVSTGDLADVLMVATGLVLPGTCRAAIDRLNAAVAEAVKHADLSRGES